MNFRDKFFLKWFVCGFVIGLVLKFTILPCFATPVIGQSVLYRHDSTHTYSCVVSAVTDPAPSAQEVSLICFSWVYAAWWDSVPGTVATYPLVGIYRGSTDNRWLENPAGQGPQGDPGLSATAEVSSVFTPTFSVGGSAIQLDTTHDVELYLTIGINGSLTVTAGFDGTVSLLCDAAANPTTTVMRVRNALTGTVVVGVTMGGQAEALIRYHVPKGHRCKLTSTNNVGTPSYTIPVQTAQVLGI